jgi:glutamate synthase (NADPH/NADH) small chain
VLERVNDWFEIYQDFPEEKLRKQGARCMDCGVPFCHTGCPVNNLIPDWNDLIYRGRWKEASANCTRPITSRNLPDAFVPRLAKRLACWASTSRGHHQADRKEYCGARFQGRLDSSRAPKISYRKKGRGRGFRPGGLGGRTATEPRRTLGHGLREGRRIGGLLRYGIPEFKMEKHVIDRRLDQMTRRGREVS